MPELSRRQRGLEIAQDNAFQRSRSGLAEFLKEHRERRSNGNSNGVSAKMTFGEAAAIHLRNLDNNPRIKPRTRHYWRQRLAALIKSWPGLNEVEVRKITPADCKRWASSYAKAAPDQLQQQSRDSWTCFECRNRAGVIYSNPTTTLKRAPIRAKEIALPSTGNSTRCSRRSCRPQSRFVQLR